MGLGGREVWGSRRGAGRFNQEKKKNNTESKPSLLPSAGVSLFWASLQDFIPPSNCRSQLPFPTAPELLAPAFRDVNYSTHGSKWVRSSVARCRITSVSLPDLGGGTRKGGNCSWNSSSRYHFSPSTVTAGPARCRGAAGGRRSPLGARSRADPSIETSPFKDSSDGT